MKIYKSYRKSDLNRKENPYIRLTRDTVWYLYFIKLYPRTQIGTRLDIAESTVIRYLSEANEWVTSDFIDRLYYLSEHPPIRYDRGYTSQDVQDVQIWMQYEVSGVDYSPFIENYPLPEYFMHAKANGQMYRTEVDVREELGASRFQDYMLDIFQATYMTIYEPFERPSIEQTFELRDRLSAAFYGTDGRDYNFIGWQMTQETIAEQNSYGIIETPAWQMYTMADLETDAWCNTYTHMPPTYKRKMIDTIGFIDMMQVVDIAQLRFIQKLSISAISKELGLSRATVLRFLNEKYPDYFWSAMKLWCQINADRLEEI